MQEINWGNFKAKFNGKEQAVFQWLCYLLFCQEFNQLLGIERYENHAGIETSPIKVGDDWVGWQAKFFDTRLSEHTEELKSSITTAKERHPELTKLVFYTNRDFGQDKKKTDPKYKTDIEAHAKSKSVSIVWKTASFFESPFVACDNVVVAKHFFDLGKSTFDLIEGLKQHSISILHSIRSKIQFDNKELKIDRSQITNLLNGVLESPVPIILSGEGGVGKTAVIKDLYDLTQSKVPLFIFKATEFNNRSSIKALFSEFGDFSISDLTAAYGDVEGKCIVIDSAEKLADIEDLEVFQEFLGLLLQHKWKIIFTTRRGYLDHLKYILVNLYELSFQPLDIRNLTLEELSRFAKEYDFTLPNNNRMLDLICNPFYLNEYLQNYDSLSKDITYSEFKDILWDKQIAKSSYTKDNIHIRREDCFLALAQRRANEGNFFVKADGLESAILPKLVADEIIGYDKKVRGYFITHDIYEEWALEKIIEAAFHRQDSAKDFYQELGESLPIRRAFRHWLSDKLIADKEAVKSLVESTIGDDNIPRHWRDEVLVSVLLSDHSKSFFELFEKELLAQDNKLLIKITFLLRIACKEIDDELLKLLGIPSVQGMSLQTLFTKPKGSGWVYIIEFINCHKEDLGLKGINSILGVLEDWNSKFKRGDTTRNASQVALFYYEEVTKHGGFGYGSDDLGKRIIKVILNGSFEIKDELSSIIDEIVSKKQTSSRDKYYELAQAMLSSVIDSSDVASAIPEKIISLAGIFWVRNKEDADIYSYSSGPMDVEHYFGLSANHHEYFPSSAYQTPIFKLLRVAPDETIDFITTLTNKAATHYATSSLSENEMEEVEVFIDDAEPIKQYISCRLWEAYRGSHVSTSLLESIHMALEKWLFEYAKTASADDLEKRCMYLLKNTKSASITAVVMSLVFAHPFKLFNVAAVLFKTKKFFLYDTTRFTKDTTRKSDLEMLRDHFPNRDTEIHQNERIEACEDGHRGNRLEDIAVQYQLFIMEGENEEAATKRQRVIWDIFDNYYKQLPDASKETEFDKTWRIYLARMDRREMQPTIEQKDCKTLISLNPQLDPELKKFSEDSLHKSNEAMKHIPLKLWSKYKWKQEEDKYRQYEKYENDPRQVIAETKEIINELEAGKAEFDQATPAYTCAVLIRDYSDSLDAEDKKFCKEVTCSYAGLPLQDNHNSYIADGVEVAVDTLPLLFGSSADDDETIKLLLFLLLFDSRSVGMDRYVCDYPMRAILHRMWKMSFKDAHSIFLGYLWLRPKYESLRNEIRKENLRKGGYQTSGKQLMDAFLKKYEKDLENIVANRITYNDLPDLSAVELDILEMAFDLLPYKTENEDHKQFLVTVLPLFSKKLPDDRDRGKYSIGRRFLEKYANFILTSKKDEIEIFLKPFLDGFTCSRHMADFFSEFVSAEDRLHQYEEFWTVWHLFYPSIVKLCKEQSSWHDTKTIVHNYLLAWPYWKKTAKEWQSLKDRERSFFKKVADEIGYHLAVLYSLSKLLNEIGSNFIDDGIVWLSGILEKNPSLSSEDLEINTIYYLENIVRRCMLNSRRKVRRTPMLKKRILTILNFLIEKGSVAAYLTREDIL
jgi:hypothetical protein